VIGRISPIDQASTSTWGNIVFETLVFGEHVGCDDVYCCVLSSLTREHAVVDDDASVADTHSANVCPTASSSATFRWEWNGSFVFSYTWIC